MDRPSASETYRFPRPFMACWIASALAGRRRALWRDGRALLRARPPRVEGREHLPAGTRYIVVMNHYERSGLPVWWAAIAVAAVVGPRDLRWIITNRFYRFRLFDRVRLPARVVTFGLGLVARVYGCVSIERRAESAASRAVALRRMRQSLETSHPRPLGSTPEAEYGGGVALGEPYPSSGKALAWLSRGTVPVVPVGVGEQGGRLAIQIGRPFVLEWPGAREARRQRDTLAERVMCEIAALLSPEQRGRWAPPVESLGSEEPEERQA